MHRSLYDSMNFILFGKMEFVSNDEKLGDRYKNSRFLLTCAKPGPHPPWP